MILYFTGTGNSQFAADALADMMHDPGKISMNEILQKNLPASFYSERPFVIVSPIYAWNLPDIIRELIRKAKFSGSRKIYFTATMGSETGHCAQTCKNICREKKLEFMGFCGIRMPDNYIVADNPPVQETINRILAQAKNQLAGISQKITAGEPIQNTDWTPAAWLKSGLIHSLFEKFAASNYRFTVSESCISCGKCSAVCPVNNIRLVDGKPVWGKKCISCLGCINRCPTRAIEIKGKTEKHGRYICPNYSRIEEKAEN